jgi:hypothetical protein
VKPPLQVGGQNPLHCLCIARVQRLVEPPHHRLRCCWDGDWTSQLLTKLEGNRTRDADCRKDSTRWLNGIE